MNIVLIQTYSQSLRCVTFHRLHQWNESLAMLIDLTI